MRFLIATTSKTGGGLAVHTQAAAFEKQGRVSAPATIIALELEEKRPVSLPRPRAFGGSMDHCGPPQWHGGLEVSVVADRSSVTP